MTFSSRAHLQHSSAGFTLLEVLVSLSIFSIAALSMAAAFSRNVSFDTKSEERSGAVMAAQKVLDAVRVQDPSSLPTSGSASQSVTIGNKTYTTKLTYCSPNTYCTSNDIRALHLDVRLRGNLVYAVDTVFSQLR